jgi:hypothetical protein
VKIDHKNIAPSDLKIIKVKKSRKKVLHACLPITVRTYIRLEGTGSNTKELRMRVGASGPIVFFR